MHDNHDSLSVRAFVRHLVEMLVAMGVGMTLLGLLDTAILRAIGLGALREQPLLDLALMSVEMTPPPTNSRSQFRSPTSGEPSA